LYLHHGITLLSALITNLFISMEHQPSLSRDQHALSTTDWLITLIITVIPIVGFVMLFIWAFGSDTNESKANWAKATLILYAISLALTILFFVLFGAAFMAGIGNMS